MVVGIEKFYVGEKKKEKKELEKKSIQYSKLIVKIGINKKRREEKRREKKRNLLSVLDRPLLKKIQENSEIKKKIGEEPFL